MDHTVLVPSNNGNDGQRYHDPTCTTKQPPATTKHEKCTPITQESDPSSSINIVKIVSNDILQPALGPSTILKYKSYQAKWSNYYMRSNMLHIQPKISELLDFFTHLYNSGTSYNVLNSSKSALCLILCLLHHIHLFLSTHRL